MHSAVKSPAVMPDLLKVISQLPRKGIRQLNLLKRRKVRSQHGSKRGSRTATIYYNRKGTLPDYQV